MKNFTLALALSALFVNLSTAQNTESLFSLPGLTLVVDAGILWEETPYSSIHFDGIESACGRDLLKYSDKNGVNSVFMEVDGMRVFIGEDCNDLRLIYDFSLDQGASIEIDNATFTVVSKHTLEYLDGRERIQMELTSGTSRVVWIEGVGELGSAFLTPQFASRTEVGCVSYEGGSIYLADGITDQICQQERCKELSASFEIDGTKNFVEFSSEVTNADEVLWDFGDGTTSTELNPVHDYGPKGCYLVSLRTANSCGEMTEITKPFANCVDSMWTADFPVETALPSLPSSLDFATDQVGMMIQDSEVLKTLDGGVSWTPVLNVSDSENKVVMNNEDEALVMEYVAGRNFIHLTADGGETWETTETPDLAFADYDSDRIFLHISRDSLIRFSPDNGTTWVDYTLENEELLSLGALVFDDFQMVDETTFVGVNASRTLFVSSDAGQTWETKSITIDQPATFASHFLSSDVGFVGALGAIAKTEDGGNTWNVVRLPIATSTIRKIGFRDALNGWAVGSNIWSTVDGGETWDLEFCQFSGNSHAIDDLSITDNEIHTFISGKGVYSRHVDEDFSCTTKVNDIDNNARLHLFPNPTMETIYCESEIESGIYTLYDVRGRLLQNKRFSISTFAVDVSAYDSGIYVLKIGNEQGRIAFVKFVKE